MVIFSSPGAKKQQIDENSLASNKISKSSLQSNGAFSSSPEKTSPCSASSTITLAYPSIPVITSERSQPDAESNLPLDAVFARTVTTNPNPSPFGSYKVSQDSQNIENCSSSTFLDCSTSKLVSPEAALKSKVSSDNSKDRLLPEENISDKDGDDVKNMKKSEHCTDTGIGTLAETSLPWRRPTSLSPVSSSVSQSLPDDEKPLHSEAPSWADNPAYHRLTESGSPYHSPNTTITADPQEEPPRLVFDIFSSSHNNTDVFDKKRIENEASCFIPPPPWSCSNKSLGNEEDMQAFPSQALAGRDSGEKAACMLVSAHDLVPPTHHSCLQPAGPSTTSLSSSHKHSQASSPLHFQCMEKPEAVTSAAIEAQVIGIQADYHHGMKDRVSQWLASTSHGAAHEEVEAGIEEKGRIMASLKDKREKWALEHETDEGTDADVESDYEEDLDTRL